MKVGEWHGGGTGTHRNFYDGGRYAMLDPYPPPIAACGPPYSGMTGITLTGGASYDPSTGKLLSGSSGNVTLDPGTYCFGLVTIARNNFV